MTLQRFLQQLNGGGNYYPVIRSKSEMAFARSDLSMTESAVSPLPESGLSEDIHFTPAGKVTLPKGEVLYKTLATAKAKYERLVEWEIPDRRDQWGRIQFRGGNRDENQSGDLWDAVRVQESAWSRRSPPPRSKSSMAASCSARPPSSGVNPGERRWCGSPKR